jgi:ectoine hydroxylase-related dioxygenase (phytanoyl-CoA dioxygenase family)
LTLSAIVDGTVGVIRNGLQDLGIFDEIVDTTLRRTGEVISQEARRDLSEQGFEKFHRVMGPREAFRLRYALEPVLRDQSFRLVSGFVNMLAGPVPPVYVCRHMYVRVMMPEDVVATERELLADEFGHMIVHAPHRDSWFSHCLNTVNLWVAIGRVLPGNGMLVYPEAWGKEPGHNGTTINRSAQLGVPYNFDLGPGDILVFSGEQLHSSEINITDETRFVLTARFTVGRPQYSRGVGWIPYYDTRLLGGPMRPFASSASRLTTAYLRHMQRSAGRRMQRLTTGGRR